MTLPYGARVLVVDDEPAIQRAVETNLRRHDFRVEVVDTGAAALESFDRRAPDVVLLDLGLPDVDGLDVIRAIRARASTPIVVLSVRGGERDKVAALDLGADDYLTKPFGVDELLARLRVALRHGTGAAAQPAEPIVRAGDLEVDLEHRLVRVGGQEVHLSPTEYDLLRALVSHPNKVLTERMLLDRVWGGAEGAEAHYVHVYAARLRKKLEADPRQPRYLRTEPGVGYRFVTQE